MKSHQQEKRDDTGLPRPTSLLGGVFAFFLVFWLTGIPGVRQLSPGLDQKPQRADQTMGSPSGVPTSAADFFQRTATIREYLREFVDTSVVPGVSIAMAVGNEFTRFDAFGYADLDSWRPVTPHTRFRIGSVSKALTAAALGLLVEEGRLDLEAVVQDYVPEFPEKEHPVTVGQLAGHQSGIRHYRGDEALSHDHFDGVSEALSVFADDPLVVQPGTAFAYSTYGYVLLSAVMERAAGLSFLEVVRQRVLKPLRMTHTGPEVEGKLHPDQATGYEPGAGREPWIPPDTDLSGKWAGGGYVSTAGDLLKFGRAHLNGAFLKPETLDLLWAPQTTLDGVDTHHGIGWQVAEMPDGRHLMMAGGNAIGGTTVVFAVPEEEVVTVFSANMGNAPIRGVPLRVLRILLGEESE